MDAKSEPAAKAIAANTIIVIAIRTVSATYASNMHLPSQTTRQLQLQTITS